MKKTILFLLTFLSFSVITNAMNVRVYLADEKPPYRLNIKGKYSIRNAKYLGLIKKGLSDTVIVEASPKGAKIASVGVYSSGVYVECDEASLNGIIYKGSFVFTEYEGKLIAVNVVEMEDYIQGVLPHEMSPSWPENALKAQAVAARTYALHHILRAMEKNLSRPFDVDNTTRFQVYKGRDKVNENIEKAVRETAGAVITYRGKIIPAYFHSSCGGRTESAFNAFGEDRVYLRGVYCRYSGDYPQNWTLTISKDELERKLNQNGYKIENLRRLYISDRSAAKNALEITVVGRLSRVTVSGVKLRAILGSTQLNSLHFDIDNGLATITFEGSGKGHGVGMAQWGAYSMAERGYSYKRIIRHYYAHTKIDDYRKIRSPQADT